MPSADKSLAAIMFTDIVGCTRIAQAFEALMRAAELHSWPFLIGSHPLFAELRKDPRYKEFRSKVGLPT